MNRLRIALADDRPIFRKPLCMSLEREPGLLVVGEAGDGLVGNRNGRGSTILLKLFRYHRATSEPIKSSKRTDTSGFCWQMTTRLSARG